MQTNLAFKQYAWHQFLREIIMWNDNEYQRDD